MPILDYSLADNIPDPNANASSGAVIPSGLYLLHVIDTSYAPNSSRTGAITGVKVEVMDGGPEAKGQRIWLNFNTSNKNEVYASKQRDLFAAVICACGLNHRQLRDTSLIHGRMFSAHIIKKPAKGDFPAKNDVEKVMLSQEQIDAVLGQSQSAQQLAPQVASQGNQTGGPQVTPPPSQTGGNPTPPWAA